MAMISTIDLKSTGMISMETFVNESVEFTRKRAFSYNLNMKSAKNKLVKSAKRIPFEVESNSTSSNMIFSLGAWYSAVIPAIAYWDQVKSDMVCKVADSKIRILGFRSGTDIGNKHVDTQIVFLIDKEKVTCHFYNTSQLILVNGKG